MLFYPLGLTLAGLDEPGAGDSAAVHDQSQAKDLVEDDTDDHERGECDSDAPNPAQDVSP
jgi:hypothetical protein